MISLAYVSAMDGQRYRKFFHFSTSSAIHINLLTGIYLSMSQQAYWVPHQETRPEKKGVTFEFKVLCSGPEACKRVRFGMETGVYIKELLRDREPLVVGQDILGHPMYETPRTGKRTLEKCSHDMPMAYHYFLEKHPDKSIEAKCEGCNGLVTMSTFSYAELFKEKGVYPLKPELIRTDPDLYLYAIKNQSCLKELSTKTGLVIVDFENYDNMWKPDKGFVPDPESHFT